MEKAGQIQELRLQPTFELLEKQKDEKAVKYVADFLYMENGQWIVEDVKGKRTDVYIIKRKLFKAKYGHQMKFREV